MEEVLSDRPAPTEDDVEEACTDLRELLNVMEGYQNRESELRKKSQEQKQTISQLNTDMEQLRVETCAAHEVAESLKKQSAQLQVTIRELNNQLARSQTDANSQTDRIKKLKNELSEAQKHNKAQTSQFKDEMTRMRKDADERIRQMEKTCQEQLAANVARERFHSATLDQLHSPTTSDQQMLKQQLHIIKGNALSEQSRWAIQMAQCTDLVRKVQRERKAVDDVVRSLRQNYELHEHFPSCKVCPDLKAQSAGVSSEWEALWEDIAEVEKNLPNESSQPVASRIACIDTAFRHLGEKATQFLDRYPSHLQLCLHDQQESRCHAFYSLVKHRGGILSLARPRKPEGGQLVPGIRFDSATKTVFISEKSSSSLNPGDILKPYIFDGVLDPYDSNEIRWTDHVQPLIENAFGGLDVTLLAYGQTGSGKTYTMCENPESMVAKTIERVFERMDPPELLPRSFDTPMAARGESPGGILPLPETDNSGSDQQDCNQGTRNRSEVSVFEIYRNKPYTLVHQKERVDFRLERNQRGFDQYTPYYHDRKYNRVERVLARSKDECMKIFEDAMKLRSKRNMTLHGAGLNSASSRSHLVCTLHLVLTARDNRQVESCIQLVDLAGSEKIVPLADLAKRKETEEAQEEGRTIMTSLSQLLDLFRNLSAGKTINKSVWTSTEINTVLHSGLSRTSPLIAFMACMRTDGNPKTPAARKHNEQQELLKEVRITCRDGSSLIASESAVGA
jgi:predicted nuclease with TOPRIM domain